MFCAALGTNSKFCLQGKVKFPLKQVTKAQRGSRGIRRSTLSLTSALDGVRW